MKLQYHKLSEELQNRIENDRKNGYINPYHCDNTLCIRRKEKHDIPNLWRPAFVRDTEKILHLPYYNRYADKTQVFSFYHNDDITRRALHVQLVSRIAKDRRHQRGLTRCRGAEGSFPRISRGIRVEGLFHEILLWEKCCVRSNASK